MFVSCRLSPCAQGLNTASDSKLWLRAVLRARLASTLIRLIIPVDNHVLQLSPEFGTPLPAGFQAQASGAKYRIEKPESVERRRYHDLNPDEDEREEMTMFRNCQRLGARLSPAAAVPRVRPSLLGIAWHPSCISESYLHFPTPRTQHPALFPPIPQLRPRGLPQDDDARLISTLQAPIQPRRWRSGRRP